MGLTLEKLRRLKGKGFVELYTQHEAQWKEMVGKAKDYTKTFIGTGEKVRPGDVAEVLQNAIKVDTNFEKHVKENSLPQKYWVLYFSDYILEQVYPSASIS